MLTSSIRNQENIGTSFLIPNLILCSIKLCKIFKFDHLKKTLFLFSYTDIG